MERYQLTVEQAFRLLARASHTTNRKRRDIAEELPRQAPRVLPAQGQQLTAMPFIRRTLSSTRCWVEGSCCGAIG
jgi:ANTAR domain